MPSGSVAGEVFFVVFLFFFASSLCLTPARLCHTCVLSKGCEPLLSEVGRDQRKGLNVADRPEHPLASSLLSGGVCCVVPGPGCTKQPPGTDIS